jgi:hypothetical protein
MGMIFTGFYDAYSTIGVFYCWNTHHWCSPKATVASLAAFNKLDDFSYLG